MELRSLHWANCASANPHSRACVPMKRNTSPRLRARLWSKQGARVMTESAAHVRVTEETPAYWRVVFDYPPFNIVDATIFAGVCTENSDADVVVMQSTEESM